MSKKKYTRRLVGIILAGFFLWLIFRQISLNEIKGAFSEASASLMIAAVVAFVLGYSCRIERWRLMLKQDNPTLQWRSCAGPLMASVAANNVLPFRAGDLLRAFGFNRRLGISTATSFATLFIERLLDLLMIVALLGLAIAYFGMDSSRLIGVGGGFLIAIAAAMVFVLLFPVLFKPLKIALGRLVLQISPIKGKIFIQEINKCFSALELMSKGPKMVKLIFWTMLAWIAEGFVFWFAALSLPSIFHPLVAWLALPMGTLATVIPSTPGFVGTFDFFTMQAMTALGNTAAASTAYTFLVHALLWLPATLAGGFYLLLHPVKLHEVI